MPEIKLLPGDKDGRCTIIIYMVYPSSEKQRIEYYSTNLVGEFGLGIYSKIEQLRRTPKELWTKERLEFKSYPGREQIDKAFIGYLLHEATDEMISSLKNNIIQEQINPINGFSAVAAAPGMEKIQRDINPKFFRWVAVGMAFRLMYLFNDLYIRKGCDKKPSRNIIWAMAQNDRMGLRPIFRGELEGKDGIERKAFEKWWEWDASILHFCAAFSECAFPDFEDPRSLRKSLDSVPDDQQPALINRWKNEVVATMSDHFPLFLARARDFQKFGLSFTSKRKGKDERLLNANTAHLIPDEWVLPSFQGIPPDILPQRLIDAFNAVARER